MTIRVLHVGTEPTPVADDLRRQPDLAVESANSASDALSALPGAFDCVILEDWVPDGGLSAVGRLRQAHPDLPVVLLVADPDAGYVVELLGSGSTGPISLDEERGVTTLASVIATAVGSSHDRGGRTDSSVPTQAIVDIVGDGLYTLDTRGRFTSVNDTLVAMTGYDREELVGEHCSIILDERDIAASEREIRNLLQGGDEDVKSLDLSVYPADGTEIPCENRFSLLPPADEFRGTVGVIRNITERKRMEAKLRESRDKIADLHEVATEMVRCEAEMEVYKLAVEAAEAILAFDICGIDTVDGEYLVPTYNSAEMSVDDSERMSIREGIAGMTYRNRETYLFDDIQEHDDARPTTEYRSVLSIPVGDFGVFQAGSREVGAFDETDAELAELLVSHVSEALARIRSDSALKESEAKYRTLVEQSRDAVFIYRGETFVFVNERTCELTGYTRTELHEMSVLDLIHPDERERVAALVQRRRGGEEIPPYETKVVAEDGSVRQFEINAQRITYDGEPAILASARDVTERKRRKREIERQNERLKEFTSVVSHDLRNPLNVATGYLDLAQETGEAEYFERIDRSLDRMEQLIDDLLSQARHGQAVTDPQLLDLSTVARAAWQNVETADAELRVESGRATVEADENQVMTMLENLYRNAIEHVGPTVTVRIGATEDGFFVADDGPGIPREDREDIFERGYSETDEGTGLGLSIVKNTVDAHGWAVDIRDGVDGGARFEFTTE